jgi:hypothetical protein
LIDHSSLKEINASEQIDKRGSVISISIVD